MDHLLHDWSILLASTICMVHVMQMVRERGGDVRPVLGHHLNTRYLGGARGRRKVEGKVKSGKRSNRGLPLLAPRKKKGESGRPESEELGLAGCLRGRKSETSKATEEVRRGGEGQ